jgi:hypothetical protein
MARTKGFLDEIVGSIGIACERPRVAPKPWNLSLDETMKFGHLGSPMRPVYGAL